MSWEIMDKWDEKSVCACGKGFVIRTCYEEGDDWDRYRSGVLKTEIKCENCVSKYHIEGGEDGVYLVPNGKTLRINVTPKRLPFEWSYDFMKNVVAIYSKDTLLCVIDDMKLKKYSTRVSLGESKNIIALFYRSTRSKKLPHIIDALSKCIDKYDEFEWNYETVKAFRKEETIVLSKNKEKLKQIKKESYKLGLRKIYSD